PARGGLTLPGSSAETLHARHAIKASAVQCSTIAVLHGMTLAWLKDRAYNKHGAGRVPLKSTGRRCNAKCAGDTGAV
ncbi:MAG: hypothetical protein NXI12_15510, partial [Alphaproteobacteria bacterium]|nr:hypothetical protein [Alphaproteobacteria bacterium]